jgi:hypothetical protein
LPATNAPPLLENWMITGELSLAAVSMTAFIEFEPMQFAAGRAKPFALASAKTSCTSEPVMTPGAKSLRGAVMMSSFGDRGCRPTF